ncbi:hypothetical protein [Streptococcus gallinaceus]|nr:hypothetical protein [Streptococcus gallinaceus]
MKILFTSNKMNINNKQKYAERILISYHGFKKLAGLSDMPFSERGAVLVKLIDKAINRLKGDEREILINQYKGRGKEKKTRKQLCEKLNITIEKYIEVRVQALEHFAILYTDLFNECKEINGEQ